MYRAEGQGSMKDVQIMRLEAAINQARGSNTLDPFVRLGRGLEYQLIIQRGRGRNAEFIAGVYFADKPTRRELRQWRDAIQRGMEPNAHLSGGTLSAPSDCSQGD